MQAIETIEATAIDTKPIEVSANGTMSRIMYKICARDPNITDCYVGQTGNLTSRRSRHKSVCGNEKAKAYNRYVYRFIRENGGWDAFEVVPLETYVCVNKEQIATRERQWVEFLKASLNQLVPGRSRAEWEVDNRDYLKNYRVDYRAANRDDLKKYRVDYRAANSDKERKINADYQAANRDDIKKYNADYRAANRDDIKKYNADYRAANRDKINQQRRERRAASV